MYQYLLFDLDGTLTDSGEGIVNSVVYALKKFNIEVEEKTSLYQFIGPPLKESFRKFYGFSEAQSMAAVAYYREYFQVTGIFENKVYDGIEELLIALKDAGKKVILATSKPEEFAVRILRHFHLDSYFDLVVGATLDSTRCEKGDIVEYALKTFPVEDRKKAVLIGDRKYDVFGAKEASIDSIGVLYGFGDEAELTNAGATYLVKEPKDILRVVNGIK